MQPCGGAVARQLRQLQTGLETLLHRLLLVVRDRFQSGALGGVFLDQPLALSFALDHCFLCHAFPPTPQALNGMLKCFSSAWASSSVFAVVAITTSKPQISSTLS